MQDPFSGLENTLGEGKGMATEDCLGSPEQLVPRLNKEEEVRVTKETSKEAVIRGIIVKVMSAPVDDIEVEEGLEVGEELNLTPDPLPEVRNGIEY